MKNKKDEAYNIRQIFEQMELDLIASMKRNLARHEEEELKQGFKFEQWQSAKLRDLQRFREDNKKVIAEYEKEINKSIISTLMLTYRKAQDNVSRFIKRIQSKYIKDVFVKLPGDLTPILETVKSKDLEPIKDMTERVLDNIRTWQEAPRPIDDTFFRSNDKKFNALIETIENDIKKAKSLS